MSASATSACHLFPSRSGAGPVVSIQAAMPGNRPTEPVKRSRRPKPGSRKRGIEGRQGPKLTSSYGARNATSPYGNTACARKTEAADADQERPGALLLRCGDNQPLARRAHAGISPRHRGLKEINLRPYETRGLLPKTTRRNSPLPTRIPDGDDFGLSPVHAATTQGLPDCYSETMWWGPTLRTNR
jgi:hypothetical protein